MIDMEKMKGFIKQRTGEMEGTLGECLYSCYESKATCQNERICRSFQIIEKQTQALPFAQSDQICSAVVEACVECEKLAFLDGVALGAALMMELYCEDKQRR